jgi:hypothetical protein
MGNAFKAALASPASEQSVWIFPAYHVGHAVQVTSAARLPRHMGNFIYDDPSFFRHSGDCHNVVQVLLLRHTEQLTQPSPASHTLCAPHGTGMGSVPQRIEDEWHRVAQRLSCPPIKLVKHGRGYHRSYCLMTASDTTFLVGGLNLGLGKMRPFRWLDRLRQVYERRTLGLRHMITGA